MKQSKIDSFMEQVFNIVTGYFPAAACSALVMLGMVERGWLYIDQTFAIPAIFSVVSIARGYVIRRVFNGRKPWEVIKCHLS